MDYKISLSESLKSQISDNITTLINDTINKLVNTESTNISDKFKEDLDIYRDEFYEIPKNIDKYSTLEYCSYGKINVYDLYLKYIKHPKFQKNNYTPKNDEILFDKCYFWPCNQQGVDKSLFGITNYGHVIQIDVSTTHPRIEPIMQNTSIPINKEYIDIINIIFENFKYLSIQKGHHNNEINHEWSKSLLDIYRKYNPKAKDKLIIEEKEKKLKSDIDEKIRTLEERELLCSQREKELEINELKLKQSLYEIKNIKECIKIKYKNLEQREDQVSLNESVYTCCMELKETALKLDAIIAVNDIVNEKAEHKINKVIRTLNHLME